MAATAARVGDVEAADRSRRRGRGVAAERANEDVDRVLAVAVDERRDRLALDRLDARAAQRDAVERVSTIGGE